MKKALRKVMLGASVSALSLAMISGVNAKASEGEPTPEPTAEATEEPVTSDAPGSSTGVPTISFDTANGVGVELQLSGAGYISYDAVDKKGGLNAKAKWDAYDTADTGLNVDLSTLKTTKESYIAVKAFGNPSVNAYKVSAYAPKVKGKYAVESGKGKLTLEGAAEGDKYEYRTAFGDWKEYDEKSFQFAKYEQQGSTLYFRVKASALSVGDAKADEGSDLAVGTITGHLPSKEFKVKIGKKANGPSVKIDYAKATLSAKNAEYRLSATGAFTDVPAEGYQIENLKKAGTVEIRTKAGTKAASKVTVVSYNASLAPTESDVVVGTIKKNEWDKKNDKAITGKGTVEIENKTQKTVAIYVDGTAKAIATIKPGLKVTLAEKKFTAGKAVTAVFAADAKNGVFQSEALTLKETGFDFAAVKPADSSAEPGTTNEPTATDEPTATPTATDEAS